MSVLVYWICFHPTQRCENFCSSKWAEEGTHYIVSGSYPVYMLVWAGGREIGGPLKKNVTNYWRSKPDFFNYKYCLTCQVYQICLINSDSKFEITWVLRYTIIKENHEQENKSLIKVLAIAGMGTQILSLDLIWKLRDAQWFELVIPTYSRGLGVSRGKGLTVSTIY